jgi:hypothetical protein
MNNNFESKSKNHFDVVIIGANISGALMALQLEQLGNKSVAIFELRDKNSLLDSADNIPFYINRCVDIPNIKWRNEEIITQVWDNGRISNDVNESQKVSYAKKITGKICKTTLDNMIKEKIILVPSDSEVQGRQKSILLSVYQNLVTTSLNFSSNIIKVNAIKREIYDNNGKIASYKYLISTILLPNFISLLDGVIVPNVPCYKKDFYIDIKYLSTPEKYHVIYCADPNVRINRVAYLGNKIYIESPTQILKINSYESVFIKKIIETLCLDKNMSFEFKRSIYPRFIENNVEESGQLTCCLKQYGICLLGSYANWRFLLMEDVWDETKEILKEIERE